MIEVESCVGSFLESSQAISKGATRVELCENLSQGGTTPSYGTIKLSVEHKHRPFVMIRARGGDFVYNSDEIQIMKEDIIKCKELKVEGVVFGALTKDGKIDYALTKTMRDLAYPLDFTFHKAIDVCNENIIEAVQKLEKIGVNRILTSGSKDKAVDAIETLNAMQEKAVKLKIVVAGGVNRDNLEYLQKNCLATEFHGKQIV